MAYHLINMCVLCHTIPICGQQNVSMCINVSLTFMAPIADQITGYDQHLGWSYLWPRGMIQQSDCRSLVIELLYASLPFPLHTNTVSRVNIPLVLGQSNLLYI